MARKTKADLEAEIAALNGEIGDLRRKLDPGRAPRPDGSGASIGWKAERYHVLVEAQRPILEALQGVRSHYGDLTLGEIAADAIKGYAQARENAALAAAKLCEQEPFMDKLQEDLDDAIEWNATLATENGKLRREADDAKAAAELASKQTAEPLARVIAATNRRADRAEARARFRGMILVALLVALSLGAALAATGVH